MRHYAGLEFFRSEANVLSIARERRRNVEETARQLRYAFFRSLVSQGRLDRVATGHTANDQAETVLLRLVRGSGTRGLGGIYATLEGGIVRPFLGLTRQEVQEEIARRNIRYRIDASNLETRFARNKVRLKLLPWLANELNPAIVKSLKGLAERARQDESYLEGQAREQSRLWQTPSKGEHRIPVGALAELHHGGKRELNRRDAQSHRGAARPRHSGPEWKATVFAGPGRA